MVHKQSIKKLVLFAGLGLIAVGGLYTVLYTPKTGITTYKPSRDRAFLIQLFEKNWHWLISEYSTDFSTEFFLDTLSSSHRPEDRGNITIKMYLEDGKPTGLVAYHLKKLYEGRILFLAVDDAYRKKGYARALLEQGITDLKNKGCTVVRLITRTTNIPAQKLYTSLGLKEYWTDGAFVRFEKYL